MITQGLGSGSVTLVTKGMGKIWQLGTIFLSLLHRNLIFVLTQRSLQFMLGLPRMEKLTLSLRSKEFNLNQRSKMFYIEDKNQ